LFCRKFELSPLFFIIPPEPKIYGSGCFEKDPLFLLVTEIKLVNLFFPSLKASKEKRMRKSHKVKTRSSLPFMKTFFTTQEAESDHQVSVPEEVSAKHNEVKFRSDTLTASKSTFLQVIRARPKSLGLPASARFCDLRVGPKTSPKKWDQLRQNKNERVTVQENETLVAAARPRPLLLLAAPERLRSGSIGGRARASVRQG